LIERVLPAWVACQQKTALTASRAARLDRDDTPAQKIAKLEALVSQVSKRGTQNQAIGKSKGGNIPTLPAPARLFWLRGVR